MGRPRRTSAAALVLVGLLAVTAGCSDDPAEPGSQKSPSASPSAGRATYSVGLELLDLPGGPAATPQPGQPRVVTITNTGKRKDAYLLRVEPPGIGGITPEGVELAPGKSAQVRVSMLPPPPGQDPEVSLVVVSRATTEEVARLELPVPERPTG